MAVPPVRGLEARQVADVIGAVVVSGELAAAIAGATVLAVLRFAADELDRRRRRAGARRTRASDRRH